MICRKCGSEVPEQSFECPYCGTSMLSSVAEEKSPQTLPPVPSVQLNNRSQKVKKRSLTIGLCIIGVLSLSFIAAAVLPPWLQSLPTVSVPDAVSSYDSLKFSNLNNGGLALEDEQGNAYYTDSNGYIHKLETNGSDTIIYEGYAFGLTYANDHIYFIIYESSAQSVCSMRTDGTELKTLIRQSAISYISAQNNVLYYIENNSPTLPNRGTIYMYDLETERAKNIIVESNACILSVYTIDTCVYYYGYNTKTYENFFKYIYIDEPQQKYNVKSSQNDKEISPYALTIADNTVYFITQDSGFYINSMSLSDCIPQRVGGSDCHSLMVYGHYIYYTTYKNKGLYRINIQTKESECVKDSGVLSPCCAGGKIYYRDSNTLKMMCVNLDGSNTHQL